MAIYDVDNGRTYLDGLERAQQIARIGEKIEVLGGVRAQIYDYLTQRAEMNADVNVEEVASELNKKTSAIRRGLNNLKSKGLAAVVRQEDTGARPRNYWLLSEASRSWSLGLSFTHYLDSDVPFAKENNKNIVFNSQDGLSLIHISEPTRPY